MTNVRGSLVGAARRQFGRTSSDRSCRCCITTLLATLVAATFFASSASAETIGYSYPQDAPASAPILEDAFALGDADSADSTSLAGGPTLEWTGDISDVARDPWAGLLIVDQAAGVLFGNGLDGQVLFHGLMSGMSNSSSVLTGMFAPWIMPVAADGQPDPTGWILDEWRLTLNVEVDGDHRTDSAMFTNPQPTGIVAATRARQSSVYRTRLVQQ